MNNKQKLHFLLIDDNRIDLVFHEKLLHSHELSKGTTSFLLATQAWEWIQSLEKEDKLPRNLIILLDIQMPLMDGFEFLAHLEAMPEKFIQKVHVICVSSALTRETIKKCKAHSLVEGILKKPLNANELIRLLKRLKD